VPTRISRILPRRYKETSLPVQSFQKCYHRWYIP
jgi:hypothetical protein